MKSSDHPGGAGCPRRAGRGPHAGARRRPRARRPGADAVVLPGDGDRGRRARRPGDLDRRRPRRRAAAAARIARAHGARLIAGTAWLAPRDRARALGRRAARPAGCSTYAEPNRLGRRAQAPGARPALAAGGLARLRGRRRDPARRHARQPADRRRGHDDRRQPPRDRRLEHLDRRRPGRLGLPRHGGLDRRGGAGQRRRHPRHLARRARAQPAAAQRPGDHLRRLRARDLRRDQGRARP